MPNTNVQLQVYSPKFSIVSNSYLHLKTSLYFSRLSQKIGYVFNNSLSQPAIDLTNAMK